MDYNDGLIDLWTSCIKFHGRLSLKFSVWALVIISVCLVKLVPDVNFNS